MAVYTEVDDGDLARFVASYGLGAVTSVHGIAEGVENSNYLVETAKGRFILTIYEKRVVLADLPFFLGLMEHLAANGITCPTPLRNAGGEALGRLAGKPAAIVTYLDGISVKRPDVRQCASLGAELARLHLAGGGFQIERPNALSLPGWHRIANGLQTEADAVLPGLGGLIRAELTYLDAHWPKALPFGVIHADLFPNNVFFLGDRLSGLIDFYFACNDFFAYDIAVCLIAWCFEGEREINVTKAEAMLRAYHRVRPLSPAEVQAMPVLVRGAALRFLLTRAHDWMHTDRSALVKPLDPKEYLAKLRLLQQIVTPAELGFRPVLA